VQYLYKIHTISPLSGFFSDIIITMNKKLKYVVITLGIGILLGVFTSFGQTYLPEPFRQLANSYSVWLLFSFIVGYILKTYKIAGVAGVFVQYLAILFYYIASSIRFDMSFTPESLISLNIVWIVGGTLAGPIAAIAGAIAAKKTKHLSIAIGFMAGLFFSEALYQFIMLGYAAEGIVFSLVGLAFIVLAYYKTKYPVVMTLLSTVLFTSVMYVGYAYVLGALFS
jgi:MFS family permease